MFGRKLVLVSRGAYIREVHIRGAYIRNFDVLFECLNVCEDIYSTAPAKDVLM